VRAINSGAGENVIKWSLDGRLVGQKSPVEIQHAQKSAELTGVFGREAVPEMSYSYFQTSGTLGGYLVTEEDDLGCSEDALRRIDQDRVTLKSFKKLT
jgi:hypothetical protein